MANNKSKNVDSISILDTPIAKTQESPYKSYRYKVKFYTESETTNHASLTTNTLDNINNYTTLIATSIALPKQTVETTKRWYKGTSKTYVTNINRSGESSMTFIVRHDTLNLLSYIFNMPSQDYSTEFVENGENPLYFRNFNMSNFITKIGVELYRDTGDWGGDDFTIFFDPVVVTEASLSELGYEQSDFVKLTVNIVYDNWYIK